MIDIGDLKRQTLFEDIDREYLEKIAQKLQRHTFKRGDHLFKENENSQGIYLIHSGKIEVSKTTPDGWKQTLSLLGPGQFFGELSVLEERRHEANAVAIEDASVFLLTKEDMERIEREDIILANVLLRNLSLVLSRNLRRMNEKFLDMLVNY